MKYESIIFDIDGTLWDSRALVAEGYNIQLKKEGLDHLCVTAEDLKPLFGKVMTEIADTILASIDPSERYDLMERCMKTENDYLFANECKIGYPKVKETLEALSKKYRLFIVSNCQSGYIQAFLKYHQLEDLFEDFEMSGQTGLPKAENIRLIMERNQVKSAVYVGDTEGDENAAHEAGIPFIHAAYGFGKAKNPEGTIRSLNDLVNEN